MLLAAAADPARYRALYADFASGNPMWSAIAGAGGETYDWPASTYIARPPLFAGYTPGAGRPAPALRARALPGPGGIDQFRDVRRQADEAPRRSGEPDDRAAGIGDDDLALRRLPGQGEDHGRQQA